MNLINPEEKKNRPHINENIPLDAIWYFGIGLIMIFIDQAVKYYAFAQGDGIYSLFHFEVFPVLNYGIMFGFLDSTSFCIKFLLIIFINAALVAMFLRAKKQYLLGHTIFAEMMILVGGISNIIDRFFYGGVIDYFALKIFTFDFYTVGNIADLYIFIGGIYLIFFSKDLL